MATFDETVKSALGATSTVKRGVRYSVEAGGDYYGEKWPSSFTFPPKKGDLVESQAGRTLVILSIVHGVSGVTIRLGKDIHAQSGVSGGGRYSEITYQG